ncbi:hypothetical protein EDD11_004290 [Mortierella claussenii]|nr:hypothetical protein EDD11_004290 [Mortierella claussenii]
MEFAKRHDAIDYMDYIKSLYQIRKAGPQSLSIYCSDILEFLRSNQDGIDQEHQAKQSIDVRKAAEEEKRQEMIWKSRMSTSFMKRQSEQELDTNRRASRKPKNEFRFSDAKRKDAETDDEYQEGDKTRKKTAETLSTPDCESELSSTSRALTSMNYILTTTEELEGFPTKMLRDIREKFVWNISRLDEPTAELCGRLDQQLALGDNICDDTEEPELRRIVVFYQMVALKLPLGFDLFDNGLEDTYCHQTIDALFAYQFPARSRKFSVDWANGEAHGSKKRRRHGYKPDAVLKRNGRQIGFLEVKPPGSSHTAREYLQDFWNLANFSKDAIDDFLQRGIRITKVAAVQLFTYLPRDQQDSGLASCIRLLNTLETFLDTIDTNPLPRTPPRVHYDEDDTQPDYGRPSKITPSQRKNMF